jgi:hypothetical protein
MMRSGSIGPGHRPSVPASTSTEPHTAVPPAQPQGSTPAVEPPPGLSRRHTGEAGGSRPPRVPVPGSGSRSSRRDYAVINVEQEGGGTFVSGAGRGGPQATPERMLLERGERSDSDTWHSIDLSASMRHPDPMELVIEVTPQTPREIVAEALEKLPFEADALPPGEEKDRVLAEQSRMEGEYLDAMANVLKARQEAFGGTGRYELGHDMQAPYREAVLPAMYEAARQFISSGSRSPARNAIITAIGPRSGANGERLGELAFQMDAAAISGAVAGVPAYLADAWVLQALARRAKLSNFPAMKAIDVKVLVPDPSPVQLKLVGPDKAKVFWRPASKAPASGDARDLPTMTELKNEAAAKRESIVRWQQRLDGGGLLRWFQPGMAGAFNLVRRALSSSAALLQPGPVFLASVAASSSAGATSKFALGMAKAVPRLSQVEVDDLVGGTQKVNLFAAKAPDAERPAVGWSDIRRLPQFMAEVGRETGSLAATSVRPSVNDRFAQAMDILRTSLANATASVASQAIGPLLASVMRNGQGAPLAGESLKSGAFLLQQFGQSTINDYEWNASKDYMKSDAHDLASELDRIRDRKEHEVMRALDRTRTQLSTRLGELGASAPQVAGLADVLHELQAALAHEGAIDAGRLREPMAALARVVEQEGLDPAIATACAEILDGADATLRLADQHEVLVALRRPPDAAPDSGDRRR